MEKSQIIKRKVASSNHGSSTAPSSQLKNVHTKMKKRKTDFLNRINYSHTFSVVVLPLVVALYYIVVSTTHSLSAYCSSPKNSTLVFSGLYFHVTLLAFTSGYHKYFTHNTFQTNSKGLPLFFVVFGSALGLGSVRWWASLHRAHHHFTDDTERDPYSIKRGVFWSHCGWLIKKPKITTFYQEFMEQEFPLKLHVEESKEEEDFRSDLNEVLSNVEGEDEEDQVDYDLLNIQRLTLYDHKLVLWQNSYYLFCFLTTGLILPTLVTYFFFGETLTNGLIYPGIIRMFCSQQCVLLTESICHKSYLFSIPTQPYNDKNSSRNCHNPILTVLTYGQANQNYHHEFPHDYRNSSSVLAFDPTKWFIWSLYKIGLVDDLCSTPSDLITQIRIQQSQAIITRAKSQLNWGTPISKLPRITPKDFKRILASSNHSDRIYIVIQNIIHDITPFMDQHPGGVQLLKASHGKDATKAFFGGVYGHSTAANNLLATMRIGILDVGNEEEVWRRVVKEEGNVDEDKGRNKGSEQYKTAEAA
ncbi:acyl-CoA desaturase 1 [[Candida] railenensis]|uniref:Acyl-CoA desaturase n=1 Tax=[Candida] railenensis TaxID=45579 RepID=A0A9P0QMV8_9ASCO|nr:acyl-CoA desaturase 1 [[Candida] railenensis]